MLSGLISHLRWSVSKRLGRKSIAARTNAGLRLKLEFEDVSAPHIYFGYYEEDETRAISQLVRPGMTVLDIGANIGYYTLLMADLVGPLGRVHAFEPNPTMVVRLRCNIAQNLA